MDGKLRAPLQLSLAGLSQLEPAVRALANAEAEDRGAIFTRREVVDFILDLVGYTVDQPLHQQSLLEPSFGEGDFLLAVVKRVFESLRASGTKTNAVLALKDAVRGVELNPATFERTFSRVVEAMVEEGLSEREARALAGVWLRSGDFLLTEWAERFTYVVGNPPYVRQELIPTILIAEYRRRFSSVFDRADLYVPFLEHGLSLLRQGGRLGFICADRWMKNRYGAPLRRLVADHYQLLAYVDMVDTLAFHSDVVAYPAIFVLGNERTSTTRVAHRPSLDPNSLSRLAEAMRDGVANNAVTEVGGVVQGDEPWILDAPDQLAVVRRLEADFPPLEETGCRVGIGVATGADKVFIGKFDELDVEASRKLPLAMSRDISSGVVKWRGYGVLNPFEDNGRLAALKDYPKFARYLEEHGAAIKQRHVSKKNPSSWYRTIDRIYRSLTYKPKLLFPDIKGEANVVYEEGRLYPHHNLYVLTSDEWELRALQAVMLSSIARLFVATYTTKMRGGYLRFQAQYVRRIRLPRWETVPERQRQELAAAASAGDHERCNAAVARLYKLTAAERVALGMEG
ncbi:Eco57I restriction-modification methylase domain-containing protein [Mesorhizobium onobrychidis]|uniref:Eco57I restriction-modification methylase domain-containing protein n=1 Tax=Mesorhizobium onobrychidis TaxID=2775404 RepID=UPI0021571E9C|nr:N-6 DNA methylase [Mesorhizobium onobrychidis]